jgi:hypothetical protein
MKIIVPFRDRDEHLSKFIPYMKARFKADIIIVEQSAGNPFNRGKLLNIGVLEYPGSYYALHDVDMLPVKSNYTYPDSPTLLATKVEQFDYKMPFPEYFGGVVLISHEDMIKCNGYHNEFWGWGGEDNNFRDRILAVGLKTESRMGIYKSLPHDHQLNPKLHPKNVKLWQEGPQLENGLDTCEYAVIEKIGNHIKVEI